MSLRMTVLTGIQIFSSSETANFHKGSCLLFTWRTLWGAYMMSSYLLILAHARVISTYGAHSQSISKLIEAGLISEAKYNSQWWMKTLKNCRCWNPEQQAICWRNLGCNVPFHPEALKCIRGIIYLSSESFLKLKFLRKEFNLPHINFSSKSLWHNTGECVPHLYFSVNKVLLTKVDRHLTFFHFTINCMEMLTLAFNYDK